MKNLPILFFLIFYLVPRPIFAQNQNLVGHHADLHSLDLNPFLDSLQLQNELVVTFRVLTPTLTDSNRNHFVLTKKGNQFEAFKLGAILMKLNLSNASLELIWSNFVQNGLLIMNNERDLIDVCPKKHHIYNAHTYQFTIYEKGRKKTLNYYYPEYYDEVCPGLDERKKIINSVAVLALYTESD